MVSLIASLPQLCLSIANQPLYLHQRWVSLSLMKNPEGNSVAVSLETPFGGLKDNSNGGQAYYFWRGAIVSTSINSVPFVTYGKIYE